MAHEVLFSPNYNGFVRLVRAFLKDAPRVVRSDHRDINNLGVDYTLSGGGARPAGDILHIAPETDALLGTYRSTCVQAGGLNSYGTAVTPTVTFTAASRTIVRDTGSWATDGFVAGELIRVVSGPVNAGNIGVFRVASITTTTNTDDTITLNALDTSLVDEAAVAITARPLGGGALFDVRYDPGSANTHLGWLASEQEFMAKDGTLWQFMRNGGNWAVNDFAEYELELGNFSLSEDRAVTATVTFNDNSPSADSITRNDYNGNFVRDGFVAGAAVEVTGSASNDGRYLIDTVTASTITLDSGVALTDEGPVEVTLVPRFQVAVDFASGARTITRSVGSWVDDGFLAGGRIEVQDAVDAGNNGLFLIDSVTATVITLDATETLADETGDTIHATPRNVNLRAWTEHRYRWSATSGVTGPASQSLDSGELPPVPDADGNYTSEWVGIGPGNDPVNNPQTIYIGFQTQFTGTSKQNVEVRGFDIVSDSPFGGLGNASPPVYLYLTFSPSMETYMRGDGEMVAGFVDVNTAVAEWFYAGFIDVHATSVSHPRPIYVGGAGYEADDTRASSGAKLGFFPSPVIENSGSDPKPGSAYFRWVDGNWVNVGNNGVTSAGAESQLNDAAFRSFTWPYRTETGLDPDWFGADGAAITPSFGTINPDTINGDFSGVQANPSQYLPFVAGMRPTPTTVTPVPDQRFGLLPVVLLMRNPAQAIVGDLRSVFHVTGTGQATKNRILEEGRVYIVGQNHEKTNVQDFAALELN